MTDPLNGERYCEVEFDKSARVVRPEQPGAVGALAGRVSDVIVLCHGWNNDIDDARQLYRALTTSIDEQRAAGREPGLAGRDIGYVGVLWPSKRFTDEELIPGGAAGAAVEDPMLAADVLARADAFAARDANTTMAKAATLVPRLDFSPKARREYAELLRSLVDRSTVDDDEAGSAFFSLGGLDLYLRVDDPTLGDPDLFSPALSPGAGGGVLDVPVTGALTGPRGGAAGILSSPTTR
jgi:hypothetical protein